MAVGTYQCFTRRDLMSRLTCWSCQFRRSQPQLRYVTLSYRTVPETSWCISSLKNSLLESPQPKLHMDKRKTRFYQTTTHTAGPQSQEQPPWRVLFFGTDQYALHHLKTLHLNNLQESSSVIKSLEVAVCSQKCKVKDYADDHGLKTQCWPLPDLRGRYDVGVIVSFGHLIPAAIISSFPLGVLNVHPSLLPAWRGASPLISTVLSGATSSGVSIMSIQPTRFDTGPLLAQKHVTIPDHVTSFQLVDHMGQQGAPLLIDCLKKISSLPRQAQPEKSPTPRAKKLKPCNFYINWDSQCVKHIDRHYRAVAEIQPLRTRWEDRTIKLLDMIPPDSFKDGDTIAIRGHTLPGTAVPGTCVYDRASDALWVRCKDGWVGFRRVVIKKPLTALAFYNGYISGPAKKLTTFTSQDNRLDFFWR